MNIDKFNDIHIDFSVPSTDKCDLCGYRKGMSPGFEYSVFGGDDSSQYQELPGGSTSNGYNVSLGDNIFAVMGGNTNPSTNPLIWKNNNSQNPFLIFDGKTYMYDDDPCMFWYQSQHRKFVAFSFDSVSLTNCGNGTNRIILAFCGWDSVDDMMDASRANAQGILDIVWTVHSWNGREVLWDKAKGSPTNPLVIGPSFFSFSSPFLYVSCTYGSASSQSNTNDLITFNGLRFYLE